MTNQAPEEQQIDLMTAEGTVIRSFQGDTADWIDDDRFLVFRYERSCQAPCSSEPWSVNYQSNGEPAGVALLGSVTSEELTPVQLPEGRWIAGNGHGNLSFSYDDDIESEYSIWSPAGVTASGEGFAQSWSHSGDRMLILHPNDQYGPGTYGWLEILSWPELDRLYADPEADFVWMPAVSPSGNLVAYPPVIGDSLVRVGDVRAATVADYDIPLGSYVWDADERLVQVTPRGNGVRIYDREANLIEFQRRDVGDAIVASADRSTIVFFHSDEARRSTDRISILRANDWSELPLPSLNGLNAQPQVAPDGTAVIVTFVTGNWEESAFVSRL